MSKIVIYGGTFNPFHAGHLDVCKYILDSDMCDKLIVVPTYLPPHKKIFSEVLPEHRLQMTRLALSWEKNVVVSDIEIKQKAECYTVDTILKLREEYENDELFLLVGSDMFSSFTTWKDWQKLGKMVTLLVVARHSDEFDRLFDIQSELLSHGVKSKILKKDILEVSSTAIRLLFDDYENSALLPKAIYQYAKKYDLYSKSSAIKELSEILKPLVTPERYKHSVNVSKRAAELGEIFGENTHKLRVAGMLHDICKNMESSFLMDILSRADIAVDIDFSISKNLQHSYAGAEYVRDKLGITDEEILNSIRYHTSARAGMSNFEKIIYLADLTSQDREYKDVHYMRGLSEGNLDKAMLFALEYIVKKLEKDGEKIYDVTLQALEEYRNLLAAEREIANV